MAAKPGSKVPTEERWCDKEGKYTEFRRYKVYTTKSGTNRYQWRCRSCQDQSDKRAKTATRQFDKDMEKGDLEEVAQKMIELASQDRESVRDQGGSIALLHNAQHWVQLSQDLGYSSLKDTLEDWREFRRAHTVQGFVDNGLTDPSEASRWHELNWAPEGAANWKHAGFEVEEADMWYVNVTQSLDRALELKSQGVSPEPQEEHQVPEAR